MEVSIKERSIVIEARAFEIKLELKAVKAGIDKLAAEHSALVSEYVVLNPEMGYRAIALQLKTNHDYVNECAKKHGTSRKAVSPLKKETT